MYSIRYDPPRTEQTPKLLTIITIMIIIRIINVIIIVIIVRLVEMIQPIIMTVIVEQLLDMVIVKRLRLNQKLY